MAVTRLIASEQEAEAAKAYASRVEAARYEATESEAKELKEEAEGAEISGKLAAQHAENTKAAIAKMAGGDAILEQVGMMIIPWYPVPPPLLTVSLGLSPACR